MQIQITHIIYDFKNRNKNSRKAFTTKVVKSSSEMDEKDLQKCVEVLKKESGAVQVSFCYRSIEQRKLISVKKGKSSFSGFQIMKNKMMYWKRVEDKDKCYILNIK